MGGSLAYALSGFHGCRISGFDTDAGVMNDALSRGAIDEACASARLAAENADLTILCLYPAAILRSLEELSCSFKPGSVVTEIGGLKRTVCALAERVIPCGVEYVGIHPMAGKETGGFVNADKAIFLNSGFIVTPCASTGEAAVVLMLELASHIGASRVCVSSAEEHDELIGYTSGLMHASAACLCMDYPERFTLAHAAGAYRDCTRIANINPELWTELLSENGEYLLRHLDKYIGNLTRMRDALAAENRPEIYNLLARAGENKRMMISEKA